MREQGRESVRIEPSACGRAWQIKLELDVGVVAVPGTFRTASSAEAVARSQAALLGRRVVGAEYGPASVELELRRSGER